MTGPDRLDFDAVILGGGIFGLFAALRLAKAGKTVADVDQGDIWTEASAVNAGSLGVQNKLPALVPFTLWSWEIWQGLKAEFGIDAHVVRKGGWKVAMSSDEANRLRDVAALQVQGGAEVES